MLHGVGLLGRGPGLASRSPRSTRPLILKDEEGDGDEEAQREMFLSATPQHITMYPRRPSSPLNPNGSSASHMGSSSPLTSPLAGPSHLPSTPSPFPSLSSSSASFGSLAKRPAQAGFTTRYTRPLARARHSYPTPGVSARSGGDLFSTEGTTPVEGAMWKERLSRRMEERERRKRARDADLSRRRSASAGAVGASSSPGEMSVEDEEEADRRAQADDEEIFRRLVILQRRRAEHAALASLERETGGSDPLLPDFWEEEERDMQAEERALLSHLDETGDQHMASSPFQTPLRVARAGMVPIAIAEEEDEELWALEAAQAEEAEREAEDAEIASRMEEAYYSQQQQQHQLGAKPIGDGNEVDWEALDAMAMDID